jgi:hypothetical protein
VDIFYHRISRPSSQKASFQQPQANSLIELR